MKRVKRVQIAEIQRARLREFSAEKPVCNYATAEAATLFKVYPLTLIMESKMLSFIRSA